MTECTWAQGLIPGLGETGAKPASVVNPATLSSRRSKAELKKRIASRFIDARNLNNYTQVDAAAHFGYKTSAQLNQWETGKRVPPIEMIVLAAHVYRVSVDFLMGVCDDPDRDPASEERMYLLRGAGTMLYEMAHTLADAVVYQTNLSGPSVHAAATVVRGVQTFVKAFDKFRAMNDETYEDLRGTAPLDLAVRVLKEETLTQAMDMVNRSQRTNNAALKGVLKTHRPADNHPLLSVLDPAG